MENNPEKEIVELHQFFQDWYNNQSPDTDENFARFSSVMTPEFTRIDPDGNVSGRAPLVKGLRKAHNSHGDMKIWIRDVQVRFQLGDIITATYQEWQEIKGEISCRLSSVVFKTQPEAPNGLGWLHVHETWLAT